MPSDDVKKQIEDVKWNEAKGKSAALMDDDDPQLNAALDESAREDHANFDSETFRHTNAVKEVAKVWGYEV